jgi:Domain of unknown function (DUF4291)
MRKIIANYDEQGICVYQAFKPSTVEAAIKKGKFDKGFSLERMTWIKPSFGWMLHRSGYATKHRQEAIIKIKITHQGFLEILEQSIETYFDPNLFETEERWRSALDKSLVRHQWDPDRSLRGEKLENRAIQIGIRGEVVYKYVNDWTLELQDVTSLAKDISKSIQENRHVLPSVPVESEYFVSPFLQNSLGMAVD